MFFTRWANATNPSFCIVGSPPEKTTALIKGDDVSIMAAISSTSR
jgi:hypothetical protein